MEQDISITYEVINSNWIYETVCAIWYHLHNLKNVKNTHGGVLHLGVLQSPATLLKVTLLHECFSHCLKLHEWYQMAQSIKYEKWRKIPWKISFTQLCAGFLGNKNLKFMTLVPWCVRGYRKRPVMKCVNEQSSSYRYKIHIFGGLGLVYKLRF